MLEALKRMFSKDNLNPLKSGSTATAYTSVGAMAALQAYPQSEYDALVQLALGIIGVYCFYKKN